MGTQWRDACVSVYTKYDKRKDTAVSLSFRFSGQRLSLLLFPLAAHLVQERVFL